MQMTKNNIRWLAWIWLIVVLAAVAYVAYHYRQGIRLQSDVLTLLPDQETAPQVQAKKKELSQLFSRQVLLLFGHAEASRAKAAALSTATAMEASGLFSSVQLHVAPDDPEKFGRGLYPFRSGLLSVADRDRLKSGRGREILDRSLGSIFSPAFMTTAQSLRDDPFALFSNYLLDLAPADSRIQIQDGIRTVKEDGQTYIILSATIGESATDLAAQTKITEFLGKIFRTAEIAHPGLAILKTGAVFYAEAGGQKGLTEASLISIISFLGCILLTIAIFRSARPLLLTIASVATGLCCGLAFCLWYFSELHVISLSFGTSLIGVSIDYSLHYFSTRFLPTTPTPQRRLVGILPGLILGFATTAFGYGMLWLAPLPGLHQMAAFSLVGLTGAFISVLLWLPALEISAPQKFQPSLMTAGIKLAKFWHAPERRQFRIILSVASLILAIGAAQRLQSDDDVRRMQPPEPELRSQQDEIERLTGLSFSKNFILVQAETPDKALQITESLTDALAPLVAAGKISRYDSITRVVPSDARQQENRHLISEKLIGPYLPELRAATGLDLQPPNIGSTQDALSIKNAIALLPVLSPLVLGGDGQTQVIILDGVTDQTLIRNLVADEPGTSFIDTASDISKVFARYRIEATGLVAVSLGAIGAFLLLRYGWRRTARILLPPVVALLGAPLLLSLFGYNFSFFSAMAQILILAIGVDYAIFYHESQEEEANATMLGVILAAITTILSFGALAFSSLPVVHSFGMTMFIGVSLAFLLAPLAGLKDSMR